MRAFQPSPAFLAYYAACMAAANGPIYPGMGPVSLAIPATITNPEELAFCQTVLAGLLASVNTYRASVPGY